MQLKGFFQNGVFDGNQFRSCYNLYIPEDAVDDNDKFYGMTAVYLLSKYSKEVDDSFISNSIWSDVETKVYLAKLLIQMRTIIGFNAYFVSTHTILLDFRLFFLSKNIITLYKI